LEQQAQAMALSTTTYMTQLETVWFTLIFQQQLSLV
jgi:hypothetical protein